MVLAGNLSRLELAVAGGIATEAVELDRVDFASLFSEPSDVLRNFLGSFERAVVWMRDDGVIAEGVRACGVEDVCCFPGLPPDGWSHHASEYYLQCVGGGVSPPLSLDVPGTGPALDVVIHPGSGGERKNWRLEEFAALAERLVKQGRDITWCLGPAEETFGLPAGTSVLGALTLVELAGRLKQAALFIGNDSGVTHLAAAVGCPTVALFGPTNPRVWAPRGEHVWVCRLPAAQFGTAPPES